MVDGILKSALEILKLAPRYLIAFGLMASVLLFSPKEFLEQIGLVEFTKNNRPWLGLTLIVTSGLFVVSMVSTGWTAFRRWRWHKKAVKELKGYLRRLTEEEKQILRFYYAKETKTNYLRVTDGVVQGLVAKGVIQRSSNMGDMVDGFAHNINEIVWQELNEHPDILDGTTNTYRTDKILGMPWDHIT
jgi:hypothetical protein